MLTASTCSRSISENTRYTNPLKSKFRAKRLAAEGVSFIKSCSYFANLDHLLVVDGGASAPAPKRPNVQMPDEYLPPNKILFLQNLPESVTKDQLVALFSQLRLCISILPSLIDAPLADTPTYTKSVLFQQNETSPLWNSWTREALVWQRMPCTIISWMEKTRSRCVILLCILIY